MWKSFELQEGLKDCSKELHPPMFLHCFFPYSHSWMLVADSTNFSPENVDLVACCENIPLPQFILESLDSKLSILQISRPGVLHELKERQKIEHCRSHSGTAELKVHSSCHNFQDLISPWEINLEVSLIPCHLYSDSQFSCSIGKRGRAWSHHQLGCLNISHCS